MHEPEKWGYVYFSSKEVGNKDFFTVPQDDKIKWELFSLYRKQKTYHKTHKSWATSLATISKGSITVDGRTLKPVLENCLAGYTISIISPFSNKTLVIKEDGQFLEKSN